MPICLDIKSLKQIHFKRIATTCKTRESLVVLYFIPVRICINKPRKSLFCLGNKINI